MTTLKKGSKGEEVKVLQKALNVTVDGDFGPKTEEAVKTFQKSKGLTLDGIVGPKTWVALGVTDNNSKCVDPSVVYAPLKACLTKAPNRTIKYLAIHYTAGASSAGGRALGMKSDWEKTRRASADFGVDDRDMVQFNPDPKNYYCWAVGDPKTGHVSCPDGYNRNTISIEICSSIKAGCSVQKSNHEGWYYTNEALNNGIRLAKILMKKYNIPIERVVRHYDISGKLCPGIIGWNDGRLYTTKGEKTNKFNNSKVWASFKEKLK